MIGTRTATALAFLLSIAAVALGITALAVSLRADDENGSHLLQTQIDRVDGDPIPFPLHDFYLSGDAEGVPHALYMYPPGYFGHVRGCKVIWVPDDAVQVAAGVAGPGLFVDPCGGARFDRSGRLVAGPAERGLDRFETRPDLAGAIVDLSVLRCGVPGPAEVPVVPVPSATQAPAPPPLPGSPRPASPVATFAPSETPTSSLTPTATEASATEPEECERVGTGS